MILKMISHHIKTVMKEEIKMIKSGIFNPNLINDIINN